MIREDKNKDTSLSLNKPLRLLLYFNLQQSHSLLPFFSFIFLTAAWAGNLEDE